jgi:hypothetical protein
MNLKEIENFLLEFNELFPPEQGQRHAFLIINSVLTIQVSTKNGFLVGKFGDEEVPYHVTPNELANSLKRYMLDLEKDVTND